MPVKNNNAFHGGFIMSRLLTFFEYSASKKGMSAMELRRKLGIPGYKTAWLLMQKIRRAMASSGKWLLTTMVEVDETYIGGYREGRRGRGAEGKPLSPLPLKPTVPPWDVHT